MKKAVYSTFALAFILGASLLTYQNCSPEYRLESITDPNDSLGTGGGPIVCDPGKVPNPDPYKGLVAELYYFPTNGASHTSTVANFFNSSEAEKSTALLYFNQINIPSQMFNAGFKTQDGSPIETNDKKVLNEYFALKYFGMLMTDKASEAGTYQFAMISDDGAILEMKINGVWESIVNNDGLTPPRMGCSLKTVTLRKDEAIELRYYYYQGPAQHIANVLLWKNVGSTPPALDAECGKVGADYFFTSQDSKPTAVYTDLLARGWSVVPYSNLYLPKNTPPNPCVTQ